MTPTLRPRSRRRRSLAAGSVGVVLAAGLGTAGTGSARAAGPVRADDGARITAEKKVGPRMVDITIASPALGKSVKARLLLPAGWRRGAPGRWPVLYAFHGGRDDYTSWTRKTDIEAWAARYDVLVVMPEGGNGSYTDWYNYGKGGTPRWETLIWPTLMKSIRARKA